MQNSDKDAGVNVHRKHGQGFSRGLDRTQVSAYNLLQRKAKSGSTQIEMQTHAVIISVNESSAMLSLFA